MNTSNTQETTGETQPSQELQPGDVVIVDFGPGDSIRTGQTPLVLINAHRNFFGDGACACEGYRPLNENGIDTWGYMHPQDISKEYNEGKVQFVARPKTINEANEILKAFQNFQP